MCNYVCVKISLNPSNTYPYIDTVCVCVCLLTAQLMAMALFSRWGESSPLYVSLTLPPPLSAPLGLFSVQTCFGVMPQMVMSLCNPCRFPRFINSKTSSRSLRSEQTLLNQGVFIMPVWGGGCNYCKQEQTCKEKWISQM